MASVFLFFIFVHFSCCLYILHIFRVTYFYILVSRFPLWSLCLQRGTAWLTRFLPLYLFQVRLQPSTALIRKHTFLCVSPLARSPCPLMNSMFCRVSSKKCQSIFVPCRWRKHCVCERAGRDVERLAR